jgi:hypothetical protein
VIISYAWTTDALLAGRKTCTRRDWNRDYAARFLEGTVHDAWNRSPRIGGQKVGNVRIEQVPYREATRNIPDADFEGEGLKFMEEKGLLIRGITPREWFERWRASNEILWVVRFKLVFKCDRCGDWTEAAKFGPDGTDMRLCPLCWSDWSYEVDRQGNQRRAASSTAGFLEVYREFCKSEARESAVVRAREKKATP